jgi:hypothetical protein
MIAQNNVTHMLVGKDLNILPNTSKRADLAVGQIGVFLVGTQTATVAALTAGQRFTICLKNTKGVLVETPVMEKGKYTAANIDTAAATQRARAIGFGGTDGSIDAVDSTDYVAHIFWKDNSKTFGYGQPVKFAAFTSSANTTQVEIADGLAANFNKNFKRENPRLIKAEVLINSAGTIVPTGAGTVDFVNGSKYVKFNTDIADATGAAKLAIGDYIKVATGTSTPAYKVVAIDTTSDIATLDMPYQGATSLATANATAKIVLKATAAAAAAGVYLTALATTADFQPGVIRYDFTEFDVELGSYFGATTQKAMATPSLGSGTYYEVAQNEWFLKGNRGEAWRIGSYPKDIVLEATSGKTYDQISISAYSDNVQTIDRKVASFFSVLIATVDSAGGTIYAGLKTVLGL